MKCPFCNHQEDKVIDTRSSKDGQAIRRRRECLKCESRFTTYEWVEESLPMVVKKDGRRERFNLIKIRQGLTRACEKRPISADKLEEVADAVERKFQETGENEIPSSLIGEEIMDRLKNLDEVAYVRFASVYRSFKDISEFMTELKTLLEKKQS